MGLDVTFESKIRDEQITIKMYSDNNNILIGKEGKTLQALTTVVNKMKTTKKRLSEDLEAYPKILEDFVRDIGYFEYLASDDETAEEKLGNVKTLLENIVDYLKQNPDSSFEEYLQNATLQTSQDEIKDGDYVSLMTVHVAKGLEFDYVFVVSLIEGIFPSERTMLESGHDGEEEERRLCYVAFTRARKKLFATLNSSYSFVLGAKSIASRFFQEAGLEFKKNDRFTPQKRPSIFDDYNSGIGYFADEPAEEKPEPVYHDTHWEVGDIAIHDVFGRGVVVGIIDDTILDIDFENHGRKSILGSHPKVHKEEKGGQA